MLKNSVPIQRFPSMRFFLFLLNFSLLASCAGIPSFKQELARDAVKTLEVGDFSPQWKPLEAGIDVLAGKSRRPRLKFYAVRIDLNAGRDIVALPPSPAGAPALGAGKIYSTTVSAFAQSNGCIVALNAGPFSPVNARVGEERTVVGIFVADGKVIAAADTYDALVFYKDGSAAIVRQAALNGAAIARIRNAIGGFFIVLEDGVVSDAVFARPARHPRSAAGLSADGRFLYLLAIDGRQLDTIGATEGETGLLLRALGAENGLNFDGGGSTALALRIKNRIVLLNRPIHNLIPGKERAVATCIGIK